MERQLVDGCLVVVERAGDALFGTDALDDFERRVLGSGCDEFPVGAEGCGLSESACTVQAPLCCVENVFASTPSASSRTATVSATRMLFSGAPSSSAMRLLAAAGAASSPCSCLAAA